MADEIKLDFHKILHFTLKYWYVFVLVFILISVITLRNNVLEVPITKEWAKAGLDNYLKQQITSQVITQNPNLPESKIAELVNTEYTNYVAANKAMYDNSLVQIQSEYINTMSYDYKGKRYIFMGDIDSYFWLRYARNIVEKGTMCDETRNDVCFDNLELAPYGKRAVANIHPYLIAYTYKVYQALGIDVPLMYIGIIVPTLVAILVAIFAFFVGYLIYDKMSGIIVSMLISYNQMFLSRSIGSDNDIYNVLIPLVILTFLLLAFRSNKMYKSVIYSFIAGACIGLSKFAWQVGWWNVFNAVFYGFMVYLLFYIIYNLYVSKKIDFKGLLKPAVVFGVFYFVGLIFFALIASSMMTTTAEYLNAPLAPFSFISKAKTATHATNVWPNVLNTVAEFNPLPMTSIPGQVFGGHLYNMLFFLALFGIMMIFLKELPNQTERYAFMVIFIILSLVLSMSSVIGNLSTTVYLGLIVLSSLFLLGYIVYKRYPVNQDHHRDIIFGSILVVWLVGSMLASTLGIRFALLAVMPMCVAISVGVVIFYREILSLAKSKLPGKQSVIITIMFVLIIGTGVFVIYTDSLPISNHYVPNYNVAMDQALLKIHDDTPIDSIINSWWDFGHYFKYTAQRRVTLDGATQNQPPLYWLGKILLTDNEDQARGMLRMLDCGSNNAYNRIYNETKDESLSVDILLNITTIRDKDQVRNVLESYGIKDTDSVLKYSHCDAPDNYFITSDDMVSKSGVWAHFGSWDFHKAEVAIAKMNGLSYSEIVQNLSKSESEQESIKALYNQVVGLTTNDKINSWIAPWPTYYNSVAPCNINGTEIICQNNVGCDSSGCYLLSAEGKRHPKSCFVNGTMFYYNDSVSLQGRQPGFAIYDAGDNQTFSVMGDYQLAGSMFTRLYYYRGNGLKNFELFDERHSPLGTHIYVWKVKW